MLLFDFYIKNLDFQYVPEDISYKVFTKGMRARWDSRVSKNEDLQLRADTVFSGLQTLFRERPGYMAHLSDQIVKKMDALLRGAEEDELDVKRNYLDALLWDWYREKTSAERLQTQGERRNRKVEYVAASKDRIYVQYVMQNDQVGFSIPQIRLPQVAEENPKIRILQGETLIFEDALSVSGNDLCLTTRSRFLPLCDINFDFAQSLTISVEISYHNEILYQSGTRLYRSFLQFDADGKERRSESGLLWLFVGETQNIEIHGEAAE